MDESDVPRWSPDDHLDRVYRRGRLLRRRRLVLLTGLPTLLLIVWLALVIAPGGSGAPHGLRTLAGPHAPTSSTAPDTAAGGATTTAVGGGDGGTTSTTGRGTVGGQRGTTSTSRPAATGGTTTTAAAPNTTTTVASATCADSDLDFSTVTDKTSYAKGETVTISMVVHNHSNRTCEGPGRCGIGPWAEVDDAGGALVWRSNPIAVACTNPPPAPPRLGPGQSATYQAGAWNQKTCPDQSNCANKQAAAGSYRAVAHRADVTAAPASFALSG
ncbi:MAG TPA: hypothetical protein VFA83_06715 [Acidimicrobiales bacterium]|nr:hypothetical protein [Acidimicrobiales bacterium]